MTSTLHRRPGLLTFRPLWQNLLRAERATSLAMRWLADYARARDGKSMRDRLANEIIDAANERGEAVKKREDTHRMAEANKAFSHYRW